MRFIVTGGLGYIGAHTVIQLYEAGHTAVILDDCRNSEEKTVDALQKIIGKPITHYNVDITNKEQLSNKRSLMTAISKIKFSLILSKGWFIEFGSL